MTTTEKLDESLTPTSEHRDWLRLFDANINRAAEGLRTIEDICRLVWEDRAAAQWSKQLRHQLAEVCDAVPRLQRLAARAAGSDPGTQTTLASEQLRKDWSNIVSAAAERTTQSLRNLEEFAKLHSPALTHQFKQLRYVAYDSLAAIELRLSHQLAPITGQIILLIDCSRELEDFVGYLTELADAGVDYFQLRDKTADGGKLIQYARAAVESLRETKSQLFINDRIDIALACGAYGVHVGQEDISLADARRLAQGRLRIGVSTHDLQQAITAEREGADYIGCGPTFPSRTKRFEAFAGLNFLRDVAETVRLPAFAIGGIDLHNVDQVTQAGLSRIALSGAIHHAPEPLDIVRRMMTKLAAAPGSL